MAIPVHPSAVPQQTVLTSKQLRVLSLLTRGKSNKQIAKELELSPNTVKAHVSEILRRLGVSTRAEAIVLAHEPLAPRAMEPVPA
ncbi:MAG: LuxR C-terminal-related transcriptional regulator [Pseudomonadota bacterium]